MTQFAQRLRLDLADALARHVEVPAYLFQGMVLPVHQAKTQFQHLALALLQPIQRLLDLLAQHVSGRGVDGGGRIVILNEVAQRAESSSPTGPSSETGSSADRSTRSTFCVATPTASSPPDVGARPGAFNTVRYSEKLLQSAGMTVTTLDLSEVLGWVTRLPDEDTAVAKKLADIKAYADYGSVPPPSLVKMAKLGVVIERWMDEYDLVATAIQCWTSLQRNFGVNVCTLMSIMSERLHAVGVRGGYHRRGVDVRPTAGIGHTQRIGRLE